MRRTDESIETSRIVVNTEQPRDGGAYMSALYDDDDIGCFCLTAVDDVCFRGSDFHTRDTRGGHGMYGMTIGQGVKELEQPQTNRRAS